MSTYEEFLSTKFTLAPPTGISSIPALSSVLFPFQRDVTEWALCTGRAALFEECGLGKTIQQLEWARVVAEHTGGRVVVLAPLAVAQQTVREGAKFGIPLTYARTQAEVPERGIVITNYERLQAFDASTFSGVVLDESSILKAYTGATKRRILEAFARTPFKLSCSATPAPNDHLELGNQSEFLGVLSSHEMIARWFLPDTSTFGTYRLKGHAVTPFWDWVASWARCFGHPADLGYEDARYTLPELQMHRHVIDVDVIDGRGDTLFRVPDMSATGMHKEKRRTAAARAAKIAEVVLAEPGESWVIWCDTDYEADALKVLMPSATEVRGSDSLEEKERAALGFVDGTIRTLISKSRIFGWGMNFQHCARMAFVGPSYSYEGLYQSLKRAHRFGQQRTVHAHMAMASTELSLWDVLTAKRDGHDAMKIHMAAAMRRAHAKSDDHAKDYQPRHRGRLPAWLTERAS